MRAVTVLFVTSGYLDTSIIIDEKIVVTFTIAVFAGLCRRCQAGQFFAALLSKSDACDRGRNTRSTAGLDSLGEHLQLIRVRRADWFCGALVPARCTARRDGASLLFDDDHLNGKRPHPVVD